MILKACPLCSQRGALLVCCFSSAMDQEYVCTPARGPLRVHLYVAGDNLGIVIVGGTHVESSEGDFGIFIKKILPGKLAERDGK